METLDFPRHAGEVDFKSDENASRCQHSESSRGGENVSLFLPSGASLSFPRGGKGSKHSSFTNIFLSSPEPSLSHLLGWGRLVNASGSERLQLILAKRHSLEFCPDFRSLPPVHRTFPPAPFLYRLNLCYIMLIFPIYFLVMYKKILLLFYVIVLDCWSMYRRASCSTAVERAGYIRIASDCSCVSRAFPPDLEVISAVKR